MSQDPHLAYTKDQLVKNMILLEEHFKNYQCPYCINKHLLAIEGYAEEGIPMSKEDAPHFQEIADFCRSCRGAKELNASTTIRRLRELREQMQGAHHEHGAPRDTVFEAEKARCSGPECHVKEMHVQHG